MKIGISGTQAGANELQLNAMWTLLVQKAYAGATELHHGGCIGVDLQAHLMWKVRLEGRVVLHPPVDTKKMARIEGADETREPRPYLIRNAAIVAETDFLIAVPFGRTEVLRSGTWSTVRQARRLGRSGCLILPTGEVRPI